MLIYNYDVNGMYLNSAEADESPLEEGVFLIPSGATDKEPPETKRGTAAKWNGSCWEIVAVQVEELTSPEERDKASELRQLRNAALMQSDWTQLADAPLTSAQKTSWRAYRKSLRDLPAQASFPNEVLWPELPK